MRRRLALLLALLALLALGVGGTIVVVPPDADSASAAVFFKCTGASTIASSAPTANGSVAFSNISRLTGSTSALDPHQGARDAPHADGQEMEETVAQPSDQGHEQASETAGARESGRPPTAPPPASTSGGGGQDMDASDERAADADEDQPRPALLPIHVALEMANISSYVPMAFPGLAAPTRWMAVSA